MFSCTVSESTMNYHERLAWLDRMHHRLALLEQQPRPVPFGDGLVFRFEHQTLRVAIIQKLARVVTGLRAALILSQAGMFQEQAAIHRMVDDLNEDVMFLSLAPSTGPMEKIQADFLDYFYLEPWQDPTRPQETMIPRPMVKREKIRAFVSRKSQIPDPASMVRDGTVLQKLYSDYVHAASSAIMDLFGGGPPRWNLHGMVGTPLEADHQNDLWNIFYRAHASFAMATAHFQDETLNVEAMAQSRQMAADRLRMPR